MGSSCSNAKSASTADSQHQQAADGAAPIANGSGHHDNTAVTATETMVKPAAPEAAPLAEHDEDLIEEALADAEVAKLDPPGTVEAEEAIPTRQEHSDQPTAPVMAEDESQPTPKYELIYFEGLRLKTEPIRLILHYAGEPYKETLVKPEDWNSMKDDTPMGHLPMLRTDGNEELSHERAIARHLASIHDLSSDDETESALIDMYVDGLMDFIDAVVPMINVDSEDIKTENWKELKDGKLKEFLDRYSKYLDDNGTGWLVGSRISWADLAVSDFLGTLQENYDGGLTADYPTLKKHIETIRELPNIKEYICNRPMAPF